MEKFDVIIVGAGLAGLAAAYTLAGKDMEVLVLERGDYPGAKNVSGGRLYVNPVRGLFPELWDQAPLERFIVHEGVTLMAEERSATLDYTGNELRKPPHQSYSVLRSRFDRWLADQAEAKGAMLLTKIRVDELIREKGMVAGVLAGGDELRADVIIACDGAMSLIAEQAGLRGPGAPRDYAVAVKEVIALDAERIDDRFGLAEGEGTARLYVGDVTCGKFGGGFLYTNKESVSLGIVMGLRDLLEDRAISDFPALMERFKKRPEIACLIKGGSTVEYAAHVIPEGGFGGLGRLYGDGIMIAGDAAGLALNMGFTVRGMEYALASGYHAAQTALNARRNGGFGKENLSSYQQALKDSFVLKDFENFREAPHVLDNPRVFSYYPEMIGDILKDLYAVSGGPKERIYSSLRKRLPWGEVWKIAKDARTMTKI